MSELSEAHARLLEALREGRRPALARTISVVEDGRPGFEAILDTLHSRLGGAHRIGITGPPGAGKSTLTAALIRRYREDDERVGVVAVDPTSPFTGGALLGDRIRMSEVATDPGVFVRSMATRGSLGGLALTTREVVDVMDAFGFDRILIETVGVGQSELAIAAAADSTAVVLVPESGDSVQAMKAGLMEISDLFVVNKADRPGAERLAREIELMLHMKRGETMRNVPAHHGVDHGRARERVRRDGRDGEAAVGTDGRGAGAEGAGEVESAWEIPVLRATAVTGEGVDELAATLERHRAWLRASGELTRRRRVRYADRVREAVGRSLAKLAWEEGGGEALLEEALPSLESGETTPYEVAARIVRRVAG
ncbi:MAG: methylmalonyl Co-A mutase-associated GTPase MeaB [Gemmatimonadota bacterium]